MLTLGEIRRAIERLSDKKSRERLYTGGCRDIGVFLIASAWTWKDLVDPADGAGRSL